MNRRNFTKFVLAGSVIALVNPLDLLAEDNPFYVVEVHRFDGVETKPEYFKVQDKEFFEKRFAQYYDYAKYKAKEGIPYYYKFTGDRRGIEFQVI